MASIKETVEYYYKANITDFVSGVNEIERESKQMEVEVGRNYEGVERSSSEATRKMANDFDRSANKIEREANQMKNNVGRSYDGISASSEKATQEMANDFDKVSMSSDKIVSSNEKIIGSNDKVAISQKGIQKETVKTGGITKGIQKGTQTGNDKTIRGLMKTTDHIHGVKGAVVSAGKATAGFFKKLTDDTNLASKATSILKIGVAGLGVAFTVAGFAGVGYLKMQGFMFKGTVKLADVVDGLAEGLYGLGIPPEIVNANLDAFISMAITAELAGFSVNELGKSFLKLNLNLVKSPELWDTLGISVYNTDGTMKDANVVFWETIKAFEDMEYGAERTTLMYQIFGKNMMAVNKICAFGTESFKELTQKIDETITDEDIQALVEFQTEVDKLTTKIKVGLIDAFTQWIIDAGGAEAAMDLITDAIKRGIDKIQGFIDKIFELGQMAYETFLSIAGWWDDMMADLHDDDFATDLISIGGGQGNATSTVVKQATKSVGGLLSGANSSNYSTNQTTNNFNISTQKTMSFREAYRQGQTAQMRGTL